VNIARFSRNIQVLTESIWANDMKITESVNTNSRNIDCKSISEILRIINTEDKQTSLAVGRALPEIAKAVELILERINAGGRMFYVGAGTSGRLGILDAAECPPTYGVSPETVQAIMAGGTAAFTKAVELAEDDDELGRAEIIKRGINAHDVVVGLSASGSTPFVRGALSAAKGAGAATVAVICNSKGTIPEHADVAIRLLTSPEVITGSTRMKAATAQKMTLNMLSTTVMIKLGKVTGNFMTNMRPTNGKLKERAIFIVQNVCDRSAITAKKVLKNNNYNIQKTINKLRILKLGADKPCQNKAR